MEIVPGPGAGRAYEEAIHAIGRASAGRGIQAGPGISIKLSALHPRYEFAQAPRVLAELYPVIESLVRMGRDAGIGVVVDVGHAGSIHSPALHVHAWRACPPSRRSLRRL